MTTQKSQERSWPTVGFENSHWPSWHLLGRQITDASCYKIVLIKKTLCVLWGESSAFSHQIKYFLSLRWSNMSDYHQKIKLAGSDEHPGWWGRVKRELGGNSFLIFSLIFRSHRRDIVFHPFASSKRGLHATPPPPHLQFSSRYILKYSHYELKLIWKRAAIKNHKTFLGECCIIDNCRN